MATKKAASKTAKSMPKEGKNPKGGLTAAGRAYFKQTEGSNLKAGVTGAADTPEKMRRKGSFLRRHFTHPRGPMQDEQGRPTRLALSAHAWGEPVPKDLAAAKKLAAKGHALLERYHATQNKPAMKEGSAKKAATKTAAKKVATKKNAVKKSVAKSGETNSRSKSTKSGTSTRGTRKPAAKQK